RGAVRHGRRRGPRRDPADLRPRRREPDRTGRASTARAPALPSDRWPRGETQRAPRPSPVRDAVGRARTPGSQLVTHSELSDLVTRFTDAFNRDDLDAVMGFFADEIVYDEWNGKQSRGKVAVRAAFDPQFAGAFGKIRFAAEDLFVDPGSGKAL